MSEGDGKRINPLAVRLSAEDIAWLQAQRDTQGKSVNSMVSTAVKQYRNRVEAIGRRKEKRNADS